jgi:WD40 repeat protein
MLFDFAVSNHAHLVGQKNGMTDAITLLYDCERFACEFFPALSTSSLHVYIPALLFTPRKTLLHETYGHTLALPIQIYNPPGNTWNLYTQIMDGHSKSVNAVAFSPDSMRFVSGSDDMTLRLWDTISGVCLNTLKGHSGGVCAVAFSPNGTRIVSGSRDKTLRLWDALSGTHLNSLEGHSQGVNAVAFSPDSTRIVSGCGDRTLRLWDAFNGAHLNTFRGYSGDVYAVAFSPDGTRILSGSREGPFDCGMHTVVPISMTSVGIHILFLR